MPEHLPASIADIPQALARPSSRRQKVEDERHPQAHSANARLTAAPGRIDPNPLQQFVSIHMDLFSLVQTFTSSNTLSPNQEYFPIRLGGGPINNC